MTTLGHPAMSRASVVTCTLCLRVGVPYLSGGKWLMSEHGDEEATCPASGAVVAVYAPTELPT